MVEVKGMFGVQSDLSVPVPNCVVEGLSVWSDVSSNRLNSFANTWRWYLVVTTATKLGWGRSVNSIGV